MQVALLRVAAFFVCVIMCVNFCHAQTSTPTPTPQLFYEDTKASQRVITQLAVDSAGNVISFTSQTSFGCGFGVCGAVLYSIAPDGSVNWITSDTHFVANTVNEFALDSSNNIFFQDFFSLGQIQGISSGGSVLPNWPININTALDTLSPSLLIDPVDQSVIAKGGSASAFELPSTRTVSFHQDGSPKWITDLTGGANNTPGMFFGPNNNIYTFSDHTLLLDRNDGHMICEFVVQPRGDVFVPITGGDGLLFSSTTTQVLRSDSGCVPLAIYNWDTNRHGFLLGYDHSALFAEDLPDSGFPGTARFIAISKDGAPLWTNTEVAPQNIVAIRQGLVYVLGVDAVNSGSTPKLFVVGENDGGVITTLDLVTICPACFKVAVGSSGVYVGDLSSTRIYKINGIGQLPMGTIEVATNNAEATFIVSGENGGSFNGSGLAFTQAAPPDTYTIQFGGIPGFLTPLPQTQPLAAGGEVKFTGTYIPSGTIKVSTNLSTATFEIDGPVVLTGNGTSREFDNVPAGVYRIKYGGQPDCFSGTPLQETQILTGGGTALFNGQYEVGFLLFPLPGATPCTANISTVFDHSQTRPYSNQKTVTAYTGEQGTCVAGTTDVCESKVPNSSQFGFTKPNGIHDPFIVNGNYTGGSGECIVTNLQGTTSITLPSCKTVLFYNGHPGIDFPANCGTNVYAAADGTVHYPQSIPGVSNASKFHILELDLGNGYKLYYLHLSTYPNNKSKRACESEALVKDGDPVKAGQLIGLVGDEGAPGAFHLHFEVQLNGIPVDPYGWKGSLNGDPYIKTRGKINKNLWK